MSRFTDLFSEPEKKVDYQTLEQSTDNKIEKNVDILSLKSKSYKKTKKNK